MLACNSIPVFLISWETQQHVGEHKTRYKAGSAPFHTVNNDSSTQDRELRIGGYTHACYELANLTQNRIHSHCFPRLCFKQDSHGLKYQCTFSTLRWAAHRHASRHVTVKTRCLRHDAKKGAQLKRMRLWKLPHTSLSHDAVVRFCLFFLMSWCLSWRSWCAAALKQCKGICSRLFCGLMILRMCKFSRQYKD
jgi:hypothetical protein